jgi:hypothetical protein
MNYINILDVVGNRRKNDNGCDRPIAIIEGDTDLHDDVEEVCYFLNEKGKEVLGLTDIYNFPERLEILKSENVQTIIIQSTGLNEDLAKLFDYFLTLNHKPKNLMLIFKEDPFLDLIWRFKDLDVYKFGEISRDVVEVYMLDYCSSAKKN